MDKWQTHPWILEKAPSDRESLLQARQRAQGWLDAHPEPPVLSFFEAFLQGFESLGEGFARMLGVHEPEPVPTAEDMLRESTEMMNRAWCEATVVTIDQVLQELK